MAFPTLLELGAALRGGALSAAALAEDALTAAKEHADLNIFLTLDRSGALAAAARADAELAAGVDRGPLHGIPIAIKDNLCTKGLRTTCGSAFLKDFVPAYDASAVRRLREAGAVLIGKTNCDEFAMGSSNENSAFGAVRNPLDPSRVPGGSSGGSAAAVAAGIVPLALGSDTGGSVRQPAALCGVVGIKPSYGRVSRHGLVAFASSLDQVGPLARDVDGAAALLHAIAGPDPLDSTCKGAPPFDPALNIPSDEPIRIGLPVEYTEDLDAEAREALLAPLRALDGVELVEIRLPHSRFAVATYHVLATAEASSNLGRFDGIRYGARVQDEGASLQDVYLASRSEGFGPEVKRRIMLGTFVLCAGYYETYYRKAQCARAAIGADFDAAFAEVDFIASLTAPATAWELGAKTQSPLQMYLSDVFTIPASLAGIPAISLPTGVDPAGLPFGLQLIGPSWSEGPLLGLARRVEAAVGSLPQRGDPG